MSSYSDTSVYDSGNVQQTNDESNNINTNYLSEFSYNDHYSDMGSSLLQVRPQQMFPKYSFSSFQFEFWILISQTVSHASFQDIEPTEEYKEDYEEDIIANQGLKDGYNDTYNQQQYQTPSFYNYQEDYFNEEDEYKYLEKEREEAENLEQQKQQKQQVNLRAYLERFYQCSQFESNNCVMLYQ